MFVIEDLKLSGYKRVHVMKPRDLYKRLGKVVARDQGSDEILPMSMNKLEQLEYMNDLETAAKREADYQAYLSEQEQKRVREESQSHSDE